MSSGRVLSKRGTSREGPRAPDTLRKFITSYGIIAYHPGDQGGQRKILLIKKRDTYSYIAILRGFWKDLKGLRKLFSLLTREEQERILHNDFAKLWVDLWIEKECKFYKSGLNRAKKQFGILEKNKEMLSGIRECSESTLWEFPKGRKNSEGEDSLGCAFREFEEETKISPSLLSYTRTKTTEVYQGTDRLLYRTEYFLCTLSSIPEINGETPSLLRTTLSEEAETFKMCTLEECKTLLDPRRYTHLVKVLALTPKSDPKR